MTEGQVNQKPGRRYFTPDSEARVYALQHAVALLGIDFREKSPTEHAQAIVEVAKVFEEYLNFEWEEPEGLPDGG